MRLIDADKLENVDFSECMDSFEIMCVIDAQPTVNAWIPCSEKLPEKYCHCLVTRRNDYEDGFDIDVREDVYIELEGVWGWQSKFEGLIDDIIAWMPLPEPYKPTEN